MASVARQPFAPLDGARLQTLTSLKNRQNATSTSSPVKRKAADSIETDDFENVDPSLFSKRSKGADGFFSKDSFVKPSSFILNTTNSKPIINDVPVTVTSRASLPRPRSLLNPKSPAAKLNTSIARSAAFSAPAGRSPTRGKRSGILSSRRRTAGAFSRVDPPAFGLSSSSPAPFSLDTALKGTIPSYASRNDTAAAQPKPSSSITPGLDSLNEPGMKSDWFFDIHEDTPEQEMTNLLQHSTCVLDISSDEENETRRHLERVEGKENVPPMDDVSQTSRPRRHATHADDMIVEKERNALCELNAKEYYSEGCDENSIVIVPGDDDEEAPQEPARNDFNFAPELKAVEITADDAAALTPVLSFDEGTRTAEELMQKLDEPAAAAAVLEPMEGTGEGFALWESESAKDETEGQADGEVAVQC